ncbi:bifunctional 2-polyprenyl-6-hydroxyphenol methylase/3-demethylubiquinol 3-O-methyltransferase UbiG [Prolixibacter sp. SD074]|jgi:SAM-dependent methyltransferase|uniref:class I SAM-dependent methyltransferase n=1 Tax=Prolixibacter sp. SD074 TaxID=2652391 RepID=UPI001299435E|nr:class I SAM-dependent methyltransferase [Prolixibacter sp. SD074]
MGVLIRKNDPVGAAIWDYYTAAGKHLITVKTDIAEDEELSPEYLLRDFSQMPDIEQTALEKSTGHVLDVGAGAGSHALWLQGKGLTVTAVDISPYACQTMEERGVRDVRLLDVMQLKNEQFDTILLLMNGLGIAGTPEGLNLLFKHLKTLLKPGGQILADSADLLYLFTDEAGETWIDLNADKYYGQVEYRLSYLDIKGNPFNWLFIDQETLTVIAQENNLQVIEMIEGSNHNYLTALKNI